MDTKTTKFEKILTSPYSLDNFKEFVSEFFNDVNWVLGNQRTDYWNWSEFSTFVKGYTHIASYKDNERNEIGVFAVEMAKGQNIDRARSAQRNFAKKLIEGNNLQAAIVAFYSTDEYEKWRLSFVKLDFEFAAGKLKNMLTPAKRYSYLVGKGEPCHTAQQRLFTILKNENTNPTLTEIEEAFSVEKITKDFFEQYKNKYIELKEHLENNSDFVDEAKRHNFTSEQFAKKLMGQIAFLYFVQKKGWLGVNALPKTITVKHFKDSFYAMPSSKRYIMEKVYKYVNENEYRLLGSEVSKLSEEEDELLAKIMKGEDWGTGPRDFMRQLFKACEMKNANYFDEYLEPLFYEALNKSRGEIAYYPRLHCKVPFLNGGLFEALDNYDWDNNTFNIPNEMFSNIEEKGEWNADGILDIFDRYNFTMNEDEPLEKEVAVDPEMLGKIFENLLDVKDRKSKGAFYTPREIVHYMCQESLVNYLINETGLDYDELKDFILYGEFMKDEDTAREVKQGVGKMLISKSILDGSFEIANPSAQNKVYFLVSTVNRLIDIDNALANIKVCDPAVGSGAFPLGMLNEIVKARENITSYLALMEKNTQNRLIMHKGTRDPYVLKLETIKNSIYAVDIEPSAVDITKLRLWLSLVVDAEIDSKADDLSLFAATKNPRPLPNLDCNILCGNSLIDEIKGVKLIKESALFGNVGYQTALGQNIYENILTELFKAQDKLFSEKDHDEKERLKQKIIKIKEHLILENVKGTLAEEEYQNTKNNSSLPYFVWELEFAKVFKDNGGFDVVIGNPPYVLLQDMNLLQQQVDYYRQRYSVASYKVDLYHLFIEKAYELMRFDGINSFITPSNFTSNNYCLSLRKFILDNTAVCNIVFYDENVFQANVNNLVFILKKAHIADNVIHFSNTCRVENKWKEKSHSDALQSDFALNQYLLIPLNSNVSQTLLTKIESNTTPLKLLAKVNFGMQLRDRKKYPNDVTTDLTTCTPYHKECYTGKDIVTYGVKYANRYCYFNRNEAKCGGCWDEKAQFANPKLLVRQIGSTPVVGIDMNGYALLNTGFMITGFCDDSFAYYILGILNSNLIKFYWSQKFGDNRKQFPKIKGTYLELLPIKRNYLAEEKIIITVQAIVIQRNSDPTADTSALEAEIDRMVYELYHLNEEEIKIVEENLK